MRINELNHYHTNGLFTYEKINFLRAVANTTLVIHDGLDMHNILIRMARNLNYNPTLWLKRNTHTRNKTSKTQDDNSTQIKVECCYTNTSVITKKFNYRFNTEKLISNIFDELINPESTYKLHNIKTKQDYHNLIKKVVQNQFLPNYQSILKYENHKKIHTNISRVLFGVNDFNNLFNNEEENIQISTLLSNKQDNNIQQKFNLSLPILIPPALYMSGLILQFIVENINNLLQDDIWNMKNPDEISVKQLWSIQHDKQNNTLLIQSNQMVFPSDWKLFLLAFFVSLNKLYNHSYTQFIGIKLLFNDMLNILILNKYINSSELINEFILLHHEVAIMLIHHYYQYHHYSFGNDMSKSSFLGGFQNINLKINNKVESSVCKHLLTLNYLITNNKCERIHQFINDTVYSFKMFITNKEYIKDYFPYNYDNKSTQAKDFYEIIIADWLTYLLSFPPVVFNEIAPKIIQLLNSLKFQYDKPLELNSNYIDI